MVEQLNIILVPHTHWDREWYQTFQQFRIRLVNTVDKLLDILERDDKFSYFMLDGQTIVLNDYLEVRPDQEERLKQHIRSGRILVGPWYLQPDEFLVSGEALIRNLQIGLQAAADFGNVMRVGYVPDCFGHIAQLPQLFQGVGIDNAVFWRGVGAEARESEFYWEAPDGTRVLVIHLADPIGYSNARQLPLHPEELATRVKFLVSNILSRATTNTLLFMNGSDHLEPQDGLPAAIEAANRLLSCIDPQRRELLERADRSRSNGSSKQYSSIHIQIGTLSQYIEYVRKQHTNFTTLSGEMRSSQYAHLLPSVLSTRIWLKQQNTATEHLLERWVEPLTAWAALLGAPYPEGLVRLAWKYLLQNHPHDSICGCSIDQVHHENRVRFAQSQQIGEALLGQAMQYIATVTDTCAPFPVLHPGHSPIPIVVFNPAPGARTEQVQAVLSLPGSLHNAVIVDEDGQAMPYRVINRWRQEIGSMPIARAVFATATAIAGVTSPSQLIQMAHGMVMTALGQTPGEEETHIISGVSIEDPTKPAQLGVVYIEVMIAPKGRVIVNEQELATAGQQVLSLLEREDIHTLEVTLVDQARETINFIAANLPAYGHKTFWLYPRGLKNSAAYAESLNIQQNAIENEFYRVEVNSQDGTLTVSDKQTGMLFTGLNRFVDGGDVGDLYTYCSPEHDTLVSEPLEPPRIELVNHGPVQARLRVSGRWGLPSACTASRSGRSERITVCSIVSEISLTPGVRRIDIHTRVENKVKDHRLRVIFPVSYSIEHASVEGTFEVRRRSIVQTRPVDVAEWVEEPVDLFPQKRFVDLSNEEIGLAILNRGLPEYEIIQQGPGIEPGLVAVALTLLRSVEWLSRGDLSTRHGHAGPMEHTPDAQCLGDHEFDYALVPHKGTWVADGALVLCEAQAFNTPVTTRVVVTDQHGGELASTAKFITCEPCELVVSTVKRSNDGHGLVVRIYNPLDYTVEAILCPCFAFKAAYIANLLEERQEAIHSLGQQSVHVHLRGGGIITLIFE